uniref:PPM-type phosphatase domain-containing protein n=1 Tax=Strongyloides stercoralis TaxID=6248 RepID=A0A0K0EGE3_STRER
MSDKTGNIKENLNSKFKIKEENGNIKSAQKKENDSSYQKNNSYLMIRHQMQLFSTSCDKNDNNKKSLISPNSISNCNLMENNYSKPFSKIFTSSNIETIDSKDVLLFNEDFNLTHSSSNNKMINKNESNSLSPENIVNGTSSNETYYLNHFNTENFSNSNISEQTNNNEDVISKNNSILLQNCKSIGELHCINGVENASNELSQQIADYIPKKFHKNKEENCHIKDNNEDCQISVCLSDRLSNSSEDGDTFSEDEENSSDSLVRLMCNRELSFSRIGMILSFLDSPQCIPPNVELNPNTGKPLPQKKIRKINHIINDNINEKSYHKKNISLSGSFQHYHYPMKLGPNSQYSFSKNCKMNFDNPKTPEDEKKIFEVLIVDGRGVARERFNVIYAELPFKTICLGPSESYNPFQKQAIETETGERYYIDSMDDSMFSNDVDISIDKNFNVNIKKACNCICRFRCPIYDSRIESEDYFYFFERSNVRIFNRERFDKILPGVLEDAKLNNWSFSMLKKYATVTISFVDSREPDCKDISRIGVAKDSLPCGHKGNYMEITILPIIDIINKKFKNFNSQSIYC